MIGTDDNLWCHFGGSSENAPGVWSRSFDYVQHVLKDRTEFRRYRPAQPGMEALARAKKLIKEVPLTDKTRFYHLVGRERRFCVDQARVLVIGKAMGDSELKVQYVGTDPRVDVRDVTEKSGQRIVIHIISLSEFP